MTSFFALGCFFLANNVYRGEPLAAALFICFRCETAPLIRLILLYVCALSPITACVGAHEPVLFAANSSVFLT